MSNIYQFQTEEQMYEEASLWVARLDRGLSGEETEALRRWLDRSASHRHCLLELADLWDRMDSLSVLSELFDPPVAQAKNTRSSGRAVWAVAASILALVAAVTLLMPTAPWNEAAVEDGPMASSETSDTLYETGIGAHSTVNLPDGTKMLLNTNTQVSVRYSNDERLLVLKRGELHVEVVHDKQRPLRVQAAGRVVEAVGTAFNVYLKDNQSFDVIVTDGRVHVKPLFENRSDKGGEAEPSEEVQELVEGQKLSIGAGQSAGVEAIEESAMNDRLSWRDGTLVFRGETLRDALDELGRYTPTTFKVADSRINDVRIAGLYKAGDVEGLLSALKENFNINHRHTDDGVIELSLKDTPTSANPDR